MHGSEVRVKRLMIKFEIMKIVADEHVRRSLLILPIIFALISVFSPMLVNSSITNRGKYMIYFINLDVEEQEVALTNEVTLCIRKTALGSYQEYKESKLYSEKNVVVECTENGVNLYYNSYNSFGNALKEYAKAMLEQKEFLQWKEGWKEAAEIKEIKIENIGKPRNLAAMVTAMMLPFTFILTLMSDCLSFAGERIAGERERGVFEKVILSPVKSSEILATKIIANSFAGIASSGLYFVTVLCANKVASLLFPGKIMSYQTLSVGGKWIAFILLGAFLLSILYSNMGILCSLLGTTVKETKKYILLLYAVTYLFSFASIFRTGYCAIFYYLVPVYNFCLLFQDVINGKVAMTRVLTVLFSGLVLFLFCLWAEKRRFQRILEEA